MNLCYHAAFALVLPVLAAISCGSQSHQQEVPRTESTIAVPKPLQATVGKTAACAGFCSFMGLFGQVPGCYVGIIPEMKSYAAPPAGHAVWEDSPKEGPPFPAVIAELCIGESGVFGAELRTMNVTTDSSDWNSFFDENRLEFLVDLTGTSFDLMTEGYLRGAATWGMLKWTCETTIPDHKRLLCEHSWLLHYRAGAGCRT
jgi:hypothetical protein